MGGININLGALSTPLSKNLSHAAQNTSNTLTERDFFIDAPTCGYQPVAMTPPREA
jgi:hypothetical protein